MWLPVVSEHNERCAHPSGSLVLNLPTESSSAAFGAESSSLLIYHHYGNRQQTSLRRGEWPAPVFALALVALSSFRPAEDGAADGVASGASVSGYAAHLCMRCQHSGGRSVAC